MEVRSPRCWLLIYASLLVLAGCLVFSETLLLALLSALFSARTPGNAQLQQEREEWEASLAQGQLRGLRAEAEALRAQKARLEAELAESKAHLQEAHSDAELNAREADEAEALAASLVAREEQLHAPHARVLACITVGFAFPEYATQQRYALLARQLQSYAEACEGGFDVTVVLVVNEGWDPGSAPLDWAAFVCRRTGSSLPIRVQHFPFAALPEGTHGTHGDLAFQHRKVFEAEAHNFDLFVCQEDDVLVQAPHLRYFLRWSSAFAGSMYYPGFLTYELAPWAESEVDPVVDNTTTPSLTTPLAHLSASSIILDWRLSDACIINDELPSMGTQLVAPWSSSCCLYMLTAAQLVHARASSPWLTALGDASTRGEFNPRFGSARWLHGLWAVVLPLVELRTGRSLVWHSTNCYVSELRERMAQAPPGSPIPPQSFGVGLNGLSLVEAWAVFGVCPGSVLAGEGTEGSWRIARERLQGQCMACPVAHHVRVTKARLFERAPLEVQYECLEEGGLHFPFVERRRRA